MDQLKEAIYLLADLTEAFTAAFFYKPPKANHLIPIAVHTLSRNFRSSPPIALGEGLVGYVAKHGVVVDMDQLRRPVHTSGIYTAEEEIKALLAVPVGDVGVLVVDTKHRQVFGEKEKKIIQRFALFIASLMAHQRIWHHHEIYGRILDLLYAVENAVLHFTDPQEFFVQTLDAGREFTGLSMAMVCVLVPGSKQMEVLAARGPAMAAMRGMRQPIGQGLVGWVLKEAKPLNHRKLSRASGPTYLLSPNEPMGPYEAFVGVPLLAWRKLIGVWAFAGQPERTLGQEEIQGLQLAGHRLASAMEHYRIYRG